MDHHDVTALLLGALAIVPPTLAVILDAYLRHRATTAPSSNPANPAPRRPRPRATKSKKATSRKSTAR